MDREAAKKLYVQMMEEEKQKYYELLEDHGPNSMVAIESAKQHNEYRQQCLP